MEQSFGKQLTRGVLGAASAFLMIHGALNLGQATAPAESARLWAIALAAALAVGGIATLRRRGARG